MGNWIIYLLAEFVYILEENSHHNLDHDNLLIVLVLQKGRLIFPWLWDIWKSESVGHPITLWPHWLNLPGSPVHGILQARILEWGVIPFSRGSSWPRDWTWVSLLGSFFFFFLTIWSTREALSITKCICLSIEYTQNAFGHNSLFLKHSIFEKK